MEAHMSQNHDLEEKKEPSLEVLHIPNGNNYETWYWHIKNTERSGIK